MSQPGNADAVADAVCRDAFADEIDAADNLVAGDDRVSDGRKFSVDHMKVGSAYAASAHADANFAADGLRIRSLL
jgi:hypothetical protein